MMIIIIIIANVVVFQLCFTLTVYRQENDLRATFTTPRVTTVLRLDHLLCRRKKDVYVTWSLMLLTQLRQA
jgi:hypothetical protein